MTEPEVWLCGPIDGFIPLLQPVVHSLLQSRRELTSALSDLSPAELRARPGGAASVEYHARHATGSLDRLTTYARGASLDASQLAALSAEAVPGMGDDVAAHLVSSFDEMVARVMRQLRATSADVLLEPRDVGRARLPSTVIGLLVHAAEHTQRHVGQLLTTAKIVRGARGVVRPQGPG
jgi:hypothetical protein